MAVQMFYPDDFNGAWVACPDPIDFRAYTVVDLYADSNAYYIEGPFRRTPRPGKTDWLGHVSATLEQTNHRELALGSRGRSGDQWDIWQAVYSPAGDDGYPKPIWDKLTGEIDRSVAEHWREHYDLSHILRRDWAKALGPKLRGKLHIYVGDMDNYYLNNAVYLVEDFLEEREGSAGRRRGGLRRPGGALLERRPDPPQCVFAAPLSPDVHPADRGRDPRAAPRRSRYGQLEVLIGVTAHHLVPCPGCPTMRRAFTSTEEHDDGNEEHAAVRRSRPAHRRSAAAHPGQEREAEKRQRRERREGRQGRGGVRGAPPSRRDGGIPSRRCRSSTSGSPASRPSSSLVPSTRRRPIAGRASWRARSR